MNLNEILKNMKTGVIAYNPSLKSKKCFNKPILEFDGLNDKSMAEAYWKLDDNAFKSMAAEKYVKLDTLIMGGIPVCLFLEENIVSSDLKEELGKDLQYYPIGFMDLHKKQEGNFVCSGLGIAQQYQGLGLSKYLISAGVEIAGVQNLIIPTQQSNEVAIKAWKFLGDLEVIATNPLHNEEDTLIYQTKEINSKELEKKLKSFDRSWNNEIVNGVYYGSGYK